jgi:hypothetical protein
MTAPSPETLEREREKLYVTDAELIRRIGLPEKSGRAFLHELVTNHPAFPKKQKYADNRRYWPAVKAYFDRMNGIVPDDAARSAAENRALRSRLPRHHPAEPLRRASNDD